MHPERVKGDNGWEAGQLKSCFICDHRFGLHQLDATGYGWRTPRWFWGHMSRKQGLMWRDFDIEPKEKDKDKTPAEHGILYRGAGGTDALNHVETSVLGFWKLSEAQRVPKRVPFGDGFREQMVLPPWMPLVLSLGADFMLNKDASALMGLTDFAVQIGTLVKGLSYFTNIIVIEPTPVEALPGWYAGRDHYAALCAAGRAAIEKAGFTLLRLPHL